MKNRIAGGKPLKTSEIAKAVGVHPNTVRLYEQWGLLQPVPRNKNGYRHYTEEHLEQMRLARMALRCEFTEGKIRERAAAIVKAAAFGHFDEALEKAREYLSHIKNERTKAEEALELCQKWVKGELPEDSGVYFRRSDVAERLDVSIDVLRNWERNGLIDIPRTDNNYRIYGSKEMSRLKIIRTLRSAHYSMMAILRMMNRVDMGQKRDVRGILDTPLPGEDIVSATDRWISTLTETESDAKEVIIQLKKMMKK
ncbi:MAG: MerR family transcriptional regulator [Firmicutes bacterium]|nr:MerR family transcriptional regulator [Bacillota bacterium]